MLFRVVYDSPNTGRKAISYTIEPMPLPVAENMLRKFRQMYVGKKFPNGRGFYPYQNARIVPA